MAPELGLTACETNLSLGDVYMADKIFVTGTVNQLAAVIEVDGRRIGGGRPDPHTQRLLDSYLAVAASNSVRLGS